MANSPLKRSAPAGDAPGVAVRRAALRLLDAVLRRGEALDRALGGATRDVTRPDDRALVHAIAAVTLRRLADLDALIDSATRQPLAADAKARMVLRIALAQALVLHTPPHAAIATALPLVDGGPRKLVHGVFGTLMRGAATLPDRATLPPLVAERWRAAWGDDVVVAAERLAADRAPIDLTLADPSKTAETATGLGGVSLMPGHVRLADYPGIPAIEGFAEGGWWVQDIAASLAARLAGKGPGVALDLCAAPGGKTLQLAAAGWTVTAVDLSESRLARLYENMARTGLEARIVAADLRDWRPDTPADVVLLDAPCSATGIFRRHPDVLHRVRDATIGEMAALQQALLARAADWVRPGGLLVYATCSLEPAEGEERIETLLAARADYVTEPAMTTELPAGIEPDIRGWVRTLPGSLAAAGGCDGFFIARLRRTH